MPTKIGRPSIPPHEKKVKISVAIDPDIANYLKGSNRSAFINDAVRIHMKKQLRKKQQWK